MGHGGERRKGTVGLGNQKGTGQQRTVLGTVVDREWVHTWTCAIGEGFFPLGQGGVLQGAVDQIFARRRQRAVANAQCGEGRKLLFVQGQ